MLKNDIFKRSGLVISKKLFVTALLVLFSIGSYTYSEISTPIISPKSIAFSSRFILKPIKNDFSLYYVRPISYFKKKSIVDKVVKFPSESIMDKGIIGSSELALFLASNNSKVDLKFAKKIAELYVNEATQEGVNPDLAFIQMCHETGFLRFNGTVDKSQNNFCGLGATGNGVKGNTFVDTKEGVRAHIQHLKAYGSTQKLNNELVDSRFKFVKRGSVESLTELTGRWATDNRYDKKIRNLLNRLYISTKLSEVADS